MRRKAYKQFSILDGMAMIAAFTLGFGLLRLMLEDSLPNPLGSAWNIVSGSWAVMLPPCWMIAALRITTSRPRFRAPGVAACLVVSVVSFCLLVFDSDTFVRIFPRIGWFSRGFWIGWLPVNLKPEPFAASVAATWTLMALDRRWRPEPSWIDRTGCVLGIYWIMAGLAIPIMHIWHNSR